MKLKFRSMENYMSEHGWKVLLSDGISEDGRLYCMATHIVSVGMTPQSLDETSITEAACLALL